MNITNVIKLLEQHGFREADEAMSEPKAPAAKVEMGTTYRVTVTRMTVRVDLSIIVNGMVYSNGIAARMGDSGDGEERQLLEAVPEAIAELLARSGSDIVQAVPADPWTRQGERVKVLGVVISPEYARMTLLALQDFLGIPNHNQMMAEIEQLKADRKHFKALLAESIGWR